MGRKDQESAVAVETFTVGDDLGEVGGGGLGGIFMFGVEDSFDGV